MICPFCAEDLDDYTDNVLKSRISQLEKIITSFAYHYRELRSSINNSNQESTAMVTELTTLYTKDELINLIVNHPTLSIHDSIVLDIVYDWCMINSVDYDEMIKELQESVSKMSATE